MVRLGSALYEVERYIVDHPGCTSRHIAEAFGEAPAWARNRLDTLYSKGRIGRQAPLDGNIRAGWYYYPAVNHA